MMRYRALRTVLFSAALLGGVLANAQPLDDRRVNVEPRMTARAHPALEEIRSANFRLDVKLVQIPVTVTDAHDRVVLGLPQSSFRVFQDEVEQPIVAFSMGDSAISAGVVFDSSGSMRNHIGETHEAIE